MLFVFLFNVVFLILSLIGRLTEAKAVQKSICATQDDEITITENKSSKFDGDAEFNLMYIQAIMSSPDLWTDVKDRSMIINNDPKLNKLFNKSLEHLTVQELATLKQLCHDAIKCVAVDNLKVLKLQLNETDEENEKVIKAIVTIVQVITELTTVYHKGLYVYEKLNDFDDRSKIIKCASVIIEDNAELCEIQDISAVEKSETENIIDTGKSQVNKVIVSNMSSDNLSDDISTDKSQGNQVIVKNNVANSNEADNKVETDIASSGFSTNNQVNKGYVEDGYLNNGEMVVHDNNSGVSIKGSISENSADNGIINVGTVNNGPTNYGTVNNYTAPSVDNLIQEKLATSIDKLYSTLILNK